MRLNATAPTCSSFRASASEGYPFSGTGNVYRFVQGLISIGVLNNIIVLSDNDAEGSANHAHTSALNLPGNMRSVKLPDLPRFYRFRTNGPNGVHYDDINGRAAAIECYLDLKEEDATIRWTGFHHTSGVYQGELMHKETYARAFLKQRVKQADYDYTGLTQVLDHIIATAIAMREPHVEREYEAEFDDRDTEDDD